MRNLIVLTVLFLLVSAPAFAQSPARTPAAEAQDVDPPPPPTVKKRYGWQIVLADVGVIAAAGVTGGATLPGWFVTGAIVHGAHGNWGRAAASVVLRVVLPAAGLWAGVAAADANCPNSEDEGCGLGELLGGIALGFLTAELVDAAIATEVVRDDGAVGRALARATRRGVSPVVQARDGRVGLGLAGRF